MAAGAAAAVGVALASQHLFDMQPCPWCVLQRLVFLVIAAASVAGWLWRSPVPRAIAASTVVVMAGSGIAAALWQHFRAAASASCNLTFADKLISNLHLSAAFPAVFEARASCADAAVSLLGISYDFWSLGLFILLGIAGFALLRSQRR